MKRSTRGVLCALSGGILWGVSGTVGQYLFTHRELSSQWLTTVRMILAGIILLLLAAAKSPDSLKQIWKVRGDALRMILFAVFGLMTCQYTYMTAISHSNSATATALQYLGQALILIVTCVRLRRLPSGREGIALLLALGGVFLLATHGRLDNLALSAQALFWGIGAAVSLMLYTLLPGGIIERYGSVAVTGYGMLIGGIVLGIATGAYKQFVRLDWTILLGVGSIVILGTAAAFTLYLQGVSDIGGVRASLFACAEPVSAALATTLWLKTEFSVADWLAFGLIFLMAVLLVLPSRKAEAKKSAPVR
ncbi:DMT family transporter [Feifania hominis]|nr:DMT family transporter [Feifania hominis]